MSQKLSTGMPQEMDLDAAWQLTFTACDPNTGATVAGVNVSNAAILCAQISEGTPADLAVAPLWVPIPLDILNAPTGG